ncbi:MAG: FkbM family methyltransferase [Chlamydiota bacterium]|nr:FkbM family methyltransferase [Chlamydiota bacterium]
MKKFYDTFIEQFNTQPTSILEIGSRDGHDAEKLRSFGALPPESVYIVEPHPESYKNIIETYPKARVFEFAVSNQPGVIDFNAIPTAPREGWTPEQLIGLVGTSSALKKNYEIYRHIAGMTEERFNVNNPQRWVKVLAVNGTTLLQLINRSEIDLIKIDVEGFTYEVLKSFGDDIRLLKLLHIEIEKVQIWQEQHLYDEIKAHLEFYGFKELYYLPAYFGGNQGDNVWVRLS